MDPERRDLTRRGVLNRAALGGVALPLLAACGADPDVDPGAGATSGPETSGSGPSGSSKPADPAATTVAASDVPVGGGTILAEEKIVVTQPSEGQFKAFTAVCTHQGCTVQAIAEGQIQCPCHGSAFSVEDGSVVNGPASAPLEEMSVSAEGDQLTVG